MHFDKLSDNTMPAPFEALFDNVCTTEMAFNSASCGPQQSTNDRTAQC